MRSPTLNLAAMLDAQTVQDGVLVQIDMTGGGTVRLCSLDTDFSFGGFTWLSADVVVSGITWTPGGQQAGTMVLGDSDLVFWSYALNLVLQDAPVRIWSCDAYAPGEAEPIWAGRVGAVTRGDQEVTCTLVVSADVTQVPKRRAQMLVPSYLLMPAGSVIQIGGQQYILERQFDVGRAALNVRPNTGRPQRRTHSNVVTVNKGGRQR